MDAPENPAPKPPNADAFLRALNEPDDKPGVQELFGKIKDGLPALEALLARANERWAYEDALYRLYHQSFKVFDLQDLTQETVRELQALRPGTPLNEWFLTIVADGTGRKFGDWTNDNWLRETRPIVEAFLHARYFLEMVVKYGRELDAPPRMMPPGWAAVLTLFGLR